MLRPHVGSFTSIRMQVGVMGTAIVTMFGSPFCKLFTLLCMVKL